MAVCTRRSCTTIVGDVEQRYCTAECATIAETCELYDGQRVDAVMGRGAAVVHALPWMDVRAAS